MRSCELCGEETSDTVDGSKLCRLCSLTILNLDKENKTIYLDNVNE